MRMPPRSLRRCGLPVTAVAAVALGAARGSAQPEVVGSARGSTQDGTARSARLTYDFEVPLAMAVGNPKVGRHDVPGGNRNFFNTVWTPGTGPAFATDDVAVEKRTRPGGRCASTNGTGAPQRLGPTEQRQTAIRYATAFFDTYLK
ncbi:hypothetical protein ACFYM0_03090 [Streptomyces sp. NPDC006487]|uniref:hypothetical protein n=1 Tax=Streptomyces sp. NPDC006487 TaxID=3364748 RepID=UPI00368C4E07